MWTDLKNLAVTIFYIYAAAYSLGFFVALFINRKVIKDKIVQVNKNTMTLDKCIVLWFLILIAAASSGCSTAKHVPSWRDAYQNRKPAVVVQGVPVYPEHVEYLDREVNYMCLAGIKPMLPVEFSNKQASDFCSCMADKYYTPDQYRDIILKLDFNPNLIIVVLKKVQNEYWAVMDDEFKKNYREIVKYPPGYFERITQNRANCIDDVNYKEYTKQAVNQD